jgi:hypothetical protein
MQDFVQVMEFMDSGSLKGIYPKTSFQFQVLYMFASVAKFYFRSPTSFLIS